MYCVVLPYLTQQALLIQVVSGFLPRAQWPRIGDEVTPQLISELNLDEYGPLLDQYISMGLFIKGVAGPPGQQGPKGPSGRPGIPGRAGYPGFTGAPGIPGRVGATGPPGAPGVPGPKGRKGPPGVKGMPGKVGSPGSSWPPSSASPPVQSVSSILLNLQTNFGRLGQGPRSYFESEGGGGGRRAENTLSQ